MPRLANTLITINHMSEIEAQTLRTAINFRSRGQRSSLVIITSTVHVRHNGLLPSYINIRSAVVFSSRTQIHGRHQKRYSASPARKLGLMMLHRSEQSTLIGDRLVSLPCMALAQHALCTLNVYLHGRSYHRALRARAPPSPA